LGTSSYITVDPLEPLFGPVGGLEILKIVDSGDALRLRGTEKVLHDRVLALLVSMPAGGHILGVAHLLVSVRDLNRSVKSMDIAIWQGIMY
jgi:hypothetical protein